MMRFDICTQLTCHLTLELKYSFLMDLPSFYIIIWFRGTLALDRGEWSGLDMMCHLFYVCGQ
jgi:hypothetical protein